MAHDAFQVVEMRLPFEHSADAVGSRDHPCGISQAPAGELDLEVCTGEALDHVDHFEHREAAAVTAVEGDGIAARAQICQRIAMRAHEIADMNIVPDAG